MQLLSPGSDTRSSRVLYKIIRRAKNRGNDETSNFLNHIIPSPTTTHER